MRHEGKRIVLFTGSGLSANTGASAAASDA